MNKKVIFWGIILAVLTACIILCTVYREPIGNWLHDVFISEEVVQTPDDSSDETPTDDEDNDLDDTLEILTFNINLGGM